MPTTSPLDITAPPAAGQAITHGGKEYQTIKEGLAYILVPASASAVPANKPGEEKEAQAVFYNPIQQFNRDLSVLAIKAYGEQVMARRAKLGQRTRVRQPKKRKRQEGSGDQVAQKLAKTDNGELESAPMDPMETDNISKISNGVDVTHSKQENTSAQNPPQESKADDPNHDDITPAASTRPSFSILDALSATGLRALRYAQEIPFVTHVTANDLLPAATKAINVNIKHNKLEDLIKTKTSNAMAHMYSVGNEEDKGPSRSRKYNVIDLDPYGTAAPFLDAAVQAVRDDGGLLCVTCTDAGVWASNSYPEKAYSLYGGTTVKGNHSHEGGLRLILHAIATSAARYGLAIEPLLSLSIDFYARVFVRVYKSAADVKFLAGRTMLVYSCDNGCGAWTTQTVGRNKLTPNKSGKGHYWKHQYAQGPSVGESCTHCGYRMHIGGPLYGGPIHSAEFITQILDDLPNVSRETYQTIERIRGMLTLAREELLPPPEDLDSPTATSKTGKYDPAIIDHHPFFFKPDSLAKVMHCNTPQEAALRGALRYLGYRATRSHAKPGSIKTDAPWTTIWEIMREWVHQKSPVKEGKLRPGTAGHTIMGLDREPGDESKPAATEAEESTTEKRDAPTSKLEIVFDEDLGRETDTRKLVRYQINPRENWGPMQRAKGPAS